VHEQSLDALKGVLNALASHSFTTQHVLSEVSSIQYPVHEIAPLSRLVEDVLTSWRSRVRAVLGPNRGRALAKLLEIRVPDFLSLLEIAKRENRHSAILRWLLDPRTAPTIAPAALLALFKRLEPAEDWARSLGQALRANSVSVIREYTIAREWTEEDRLDRIDIVVLGPTFILAIENKVQAHEHGEQTRRYWEWLEPLRMQRAGIFLSPSGAVAASAAFRPMSYLDLLTCLLDGVVDQSLTAEEEIVMASYVRTLASGILRSEVQAAISGECAA